MTVHYNSQSKTMLEYHNYKNKSDRRSNGTQTTGVRFHLPDGCSGSRLVKPNEAKAWFQISNNWREVAFEVSKLWLRKARFSYTKGAGGYTKLHTMNLWPLNNLGESGT